MRNLTNHTRTDIIREVNPVIIDTDPGMDDAIAIFTAHESGLDIAVIVTTYGNVCGDTTYDNTLRLTSLFGISAKIIRGTETPLNADAKREDASFFHGNNGMGGIELPHHNIAPPNKTAETDEGCDVLLSEIKSIEKIDYIALGPLTNLARLIKNHPTVKNNIENVVIMGGGFDVFNSPHDSEFNIYCDPDAADIVFASGMNITLVPLDLTHKIILNKTDLDNITRPVDSVKKEIIKKILDKNLEASVVENSLEGAVLHDAAAVFAYTDPSAFSFETASVTVNKYGKTTRTDGNIKIAIEADVDFIKEKLKKAVSG